jgi:nucleotidyltransferase/DNA polymerase involved in DNA repair
LRPSAKGRRGGATLAALRNVGKATLADFRLLGVETVADLTGQEADAL